MLTVKTKKLERAFAFEGTSGSWTRDLESQNLKGAVWTRKVDAAFILSLIQTEKKTVGVRLMSTSEGERGANKTASRYWQGQMS